MWSVVLVKATHRRNRIYRVWTKDDGTKGTKYDAHTITKEQRKHVGPLKSEPVAPQTRRRSFGPKQVPRRPWEMRPQANTGRTLSPSHRRRVRKRRLAKRIRAAQRREERLSMSEADQAAEILEYDLAVLKCVNSYPRLRRYDISLYRRILGDPTWEHNGGKYVDIE